MADPYTGVIAWNNAEGGTDGVTVTTGNSGGASGTAWSSVSINGAATLVYETTGAVHDTTSYLITPNANNVALIWTSAVTGTITTQSCGVFHIRFTSLPTASSNLCLVQQTNGGTTAYRVQVLATGLLRLVNSGGTALTAATGTAFTTGTVYRVEWQVNHATGAWGVQGFPGDSVTAQQSASGTGASMGTQAQQFTFGRSQTPDYTAMWDTIAINTSALGPRTIATTHVAAATISTTAAFTAAAQTGIYWGPPTNLTVTTVSASQLDLTWDPVVNASGYDIERDGVVVATDVIGTYYPDAGLDGGTTYDYRIRSVRGARDVAAHAAVNLNVAAAVGFTGGYIATAAAVFAAAVIGTAGTGGTTTGLGLGPLGTMPLGGS